MHLHKVVADLVEAQNNHDSFAYVNCFSEAAVVYDEGKTHKGKAEIQQWIEHSDQKYGTVLKTISYEKKGSEDLLQAEASGNFPGSRGVLKFHLTRENDLITSLKITG